MAKMLSPQSNISQQRARSVLAELPRESRYLRTAEGSAGRSRQGLAARGVGFRLKFAWEIWNIRHLAFTKSGYRGNVNGGYKCAKSNA